MLKTFVYTSSLLIILSTGLSPVNAQDTIPIPLKIKVGIEVSGPAIYYSDKNISNTEGYFAVDLNEKISVLFGAGHLNYKYSQYNYNYLNKGSFVRVGIDFNLLKPDKSLGKYWVGIGLHYGLSRFNSQTPFLKQDNYWGSTSSIIAQQINWGHFIEATPGVRTEIFKNFSIGWTISMRMLLYSSTGKDLRPIYFPGFGNAGNTISAGVNYFIVWNIPYKKINAILKKEVPEEPEDSNAPVPGQPPPVIRP
jgi:hypothetical protein